MPSRYIVFAGKSYYPFGGMEDYVASYYMEEDALEEAKKLKAWERDWSQVYDSDIHKITHKFEVANNNEAIELELEEGDDCPWEHR